MGIDEILNELSVQTKLSREELMKKIEKKQKELSVVSIEGAAQLYAKELGLSIEADRHKNIEIKDVIGGMKSVNIAGRIFQISNINTFKRKDGTEGKVVNLLIGDSSGFLKLVLWDKQTELVSEKIIGVNHSIRVSNALARENPYGDMEVTIGKFGSIRSSNEESLPDADDLLHKYATIPNQRISISDIRLGTFEIKGTIVQVFPGKFIFFVCPDCGKSLDTNICKDHGEVEPLPAFVVNAVLDDGTGDIRVTFFRNTAEQVLGISAKEVAAIAELNRYDLIKEKLLGKELVIQGRVKKNKDFNRFELTASSIKEINPLEESKRIAEELERDNG
jgi:ssDNA-binding replication factor A large subunit